MTESASGMLELADGTMFLRRWGRSDAPAILAVHQLGIAGSSLHLAGLAEGLCSSYDVQVLAPDLPGFGGSPPWAAEAYLPSRLAGLLLSLLDRLGLARASLLGLSWGATLACHVAALAPDRVEALVLLDGGHVDPADLPGFETGATVKDRVRAAQRSLAGFRFRRLDEALNRVSDDYPSWTPILEESWTAGLRLHRGGVVPRLRPSTFGGAVHGLAVEPVSTTWPALAAAGIPILLLSADEPADVREVQRAARDRFGSVVGQAEVRVVAGQRHDLVAGLGDGLVPLIGDWLASAHRR